MELTLNLPVKEWYGPSARNDPTYWGIDYPPLTAFHEVIMGYFSHLCEPASVELFASRGYESRSHRLFVRLSVVVSELVTYFPAAYLVSSALNASERMQFSTFVMLILSPCLIFVDHGHFQYNSVALGFFLGATYCVLRKKSLLGAIFYSCSFLYKQTLLYFSPIFFAYMLGEALKRPTKLNALLRVAKIGLSVILTIGVHLLPFIAGCTDIMCIKMQVTSILTKIFPFNRGVFEDYVGNIWIVTSPFLRLRHAAPDFLRLVAVASAVGTFAGFLPVCWALVTKPRRELFTVGLVVSSLSFYLFSWMVHEKAVLLPSTALLSSLPFLLVSGNSDLILRIAEAGIMSLWRLMTYDKCAVGGVAISLLGYCLLRYTISCGNAEAGAPMKHYRREVRLMPVFTNSIALIGILLDLAVKPPSRFPYLWPYVISLGCCGTFVLSWFRMTAIVLRK